MKNTKDRFQRLAELVEYLCSPKGCPWDREQTNRSLKNALIEEAEEIKEAIEDDDIDSFREELGDLLYVILFHAQIAKERGLFDIEDVLQGSFEKMVRRHEHVFGERKANNSKEAYERWQMIKNKEKKKKTKVKPKATK